MRMGSRFWRCSLISSFTFEVIASQRPYVLLPYHVPVMPSSRSLAHVPHLIASTASLVTIAFSLRTLSSTLVRFIASLCRIVNCTSFVVLIPTICCIVDKCSIYHLLNPTQVVISESNLSNLCVRGSSEVVATDQLHR